MRSGGCGTARGLTCAATARGMIPESWAVASLRPTPAPGLQFRGQLPWSTGSSRPEPTHGANPWRLPPDSGIMPRAVAAQEKPLILPRALSPPFKDLLWLGPPGNQPVPPAQLASCRSGVTRWSAIRRSCGHGGKRHRGKFQRRLPQGPRWPGPAGGSVTRVAHTARPEQILKGGRESARAGCGIFPGLLPLAA